MPRSVQRLTDRAYGSGIHASGRGRSGTGRWEDRMGLPQRLAGQCLGADDSTWSIIGQSGARISCGRCGRFVTSGDIRLHRGRVGVTIGVWTAVFFSVADHPERRSLGGLAERQGSCLLCMVRKHSARQGVLPGNYCPTVHHESAHCSQEHGSPAQCRS